MEYGITMFVTDYSIPATELAVAVEERGFDALFVPDHTHIPADRTSPFAGGDVLPDDYIRNHDMFATLTAAAAVTKRIRLGTGICLVVERDPIDTAKQIASLDQISGGRVDFGIGGGWNREEMETHGTPWNRRWKIVRERIEAMKAIWTEEEASYRVSSSISTTSGPGQSRCRNRIRRSGSVETRPERSSVCCGTAMAGFHPSAAMKLPICSSWIEWRS